MRRTEICGIPYDNITLNEIGGTIEQMLREERPHMVYYCNAETVVRARRNTRLRDALNRVIRDAKRLSKKAKLKKAA